MSKVNYKALISFGGGVNMAIGEIRTFDSVKDKAVINDLLQAGYIEEIKETKAKKQKE